MNGTNTTFTLSETPLPGSLALFLNGINQMPSIDYTLSGDTITYVVPPKSTDLMVARYAQPLSTISFTTEVPSGSMNGTNVLFTLTTTPVAESLSLFLNGISQIPSVNYTISGPFITYAIAPKSTDQMLALYAH